MSDLEPEQQVRQRALELAVQTISRAQRFTSYGIVHTADLYARFISDGAVPPRATVQEDAQEGEPSSDAV